ncbi:MAG: carbamoyl-phosphate synthase large subunit, partial [Amphiplicatus sp.]
MPKRTDISSILIIGAGPIVIGQACEFDYSGVQAVKALKSEGYRVILVNSNPATIMTDPELADATYIEPITPEFVEKVIAKERPDALLPTMGGQTALNCALDLERAGVLEAYGVEMIGARADVIEKAEDRKLFRAAMEKIGLENPRAAIASSPPIRNAAGKIVGYDRNAGVAEAMSVIDEIGLPAIIRPAFTLGGTGGGVAYNKEEYEQIVRSGIDASPVGQALIDESLIGWKEFEMEVVRDKADNCIIVCSIENVDPMGVHTGDSITVAPALTLTDKEFQIMRNASIAVMREIGVETGGSNVQFAVDPETGRLVVIEMNPRVSRSSALASKATGFPIAKVAAKLAVGYTLDELDNDITGATPAAFEPTIDYVVAKIPRFAFEKFPGAEPTLTTAMKSVGEAMAIGRTFAESVQKALRSLETGLSGFDPIVVPGLGEDDDVNAFRAALAAPTPDRLRVTAEAFRHGLPIEQVRAITQYDPWFLEQIETIVAAERRVADEGVPADPERLRALKAMGFSDKRLAALAGGTEAEVRALRREAGVRPVYKRIDTCAAEFAAKTPYMYSAYEPPLDGARACEAAPSARKKVIILGGGPNRIGQGIEFDYCCCHAAFALADIGVESIMVNCNPETVSTDYDTSDRLYFEPLTAEDVLEIVETERAKGELLGVIVQYGGQTPLKLAATLDAEGVPILGTPYDAIDLAEDRERFQKLIQRLGLKQPSNATAPNREDAPARAAEVGYPLVTRPSYVLGGRAMEIVRDEAALRHYLATALIEISADEPLLLDQYLQNAIEVDVDAISDGVEVFIAGVMEHIEEAGVHSGDSACSLPPYTLSEALIAELESQTRKMALALGVIGLMNVQYAIKDGDIYVLEVNPRASRTAPFVAKTTGQPVARLGAKVMAGAKIRDLNLVPPRPAHTAVKEVVFPFARFPGVDTVLGPEMRSTGEVMGIDRNFDKARAKSLVAIGARIPLEGCVFVSLRDSDKPAM